MSASTMTITPPLGRLDEKCTSLDLIFWQTPDECSRWEGGVGRGWRQLSQEVLSRHDGRNNVVIITYYMKSKINFM